MKDTTPKEATKASEGHAETKAHAPSAPLLSKKSSFGWARALLIAVPLALVGIFIVFSSFAATASETYVRDLYTGILGRTPAVTDSGVKYWASQIDSGKATKAAVYTALYNSSEAKNYRAKLIQSGNYAVPTTPAQQAKQAASDSKKPVTGSANAAQVAAQTAWVKKAYKEVFGREIDSAGLTFWVDQLTKQGKSQSEVRKVFNDKKTASDAKSAVSSKTTTKLTEKQCRAQVLKQGGFPSDSSWTTKRASETIVKDVYIAYTTDEAWELSGEMIKQAEQIASCQKTRSQLTAELKASPSGQAKAAKESDYEENVKKPINNAYMQLFLSAWEAKGRKFTVVPFQLSAYGVETCTKFMAEYKSGSGTIAPYYCFVNLGLDALGSSGSENQVWGQIVRNGGIGVEGAVEAILSGSVGLCPKNVYGDDAAVEAIFPSCANGGQFISKDDYASGQEKLAASKKAQLPKPKITPLKPASGTNSISY